MKSPIRYPGGKGNHVKKLLSLMPPHDAYCEVFGGGASLLFAKAPVKLEVYNDLNHGATALFRVLRDPCKFQQFYIKALLTPYGREEYYYARDNWYNAVDEIERALLFYVMSRQGFGANQYKQGWSFRTPVNDYTNIITRWLSALERLPEIHQRLQCVQIDNLHYVECIERYDHQNMFMYLDPPYYGITGLYSCEFTEQDHENLIGMLAGVKSKVMLSNYRNDLYDLLEDYGWCSYDFATTQGTSAGVSKNKVMAQRVETMYMNYDPEALIGSTS